MIQISEDDYNTINGRLRILQTNYDGTDSLSLSDQSSGSDLPDLFLSLEDQYSQNVGSDSSSTATLSINTTGVSTTYTPVLSGTTTVTASSGTFLFSGISFTAAPGSTYNLYITTTGIDSTKPSNVDYLATIGKTSSTLDIEVELRS